MGSEAKIKNEGGEGLRNKNNEGRRRPENFPVNLSRHLSQMLFFSEIMKQFFPRNYQLSRRSHQFYENGVSSGRVSIL